MPAVADTMTSKQSFHDLPPALIKKIVSFARGSRCIAGTNRYARVSKAWRTASSADADDDLLQLYVDQQNMAKDDLNTSTRWLARHGSHVSVLALSSTSWAFAKTLLGLPGFGSSLKELNLHGNNSLMGLLAAKVQLPRLERLGARLSQYKAWKVDPSMVLLSDADQSAGKLHPLQQACPGLVQVYLGLDGEEPQGQPMFDSVDQLLPQLLPPTVRKLSLSWLARDSRPDLHINQALGHMTALQQLELETFCVADDASSLVLPPDCTLAVWHCSNGVRLPNPDCWVSFSQRLTGMFMFDIWGDWTTLGQQTGLTGLYMRTPNGTAAWRGRGDIMSSLTALVKLDLQESMMAVHKDTQEILQHVSGTSTLRCLKLDTTHMVDGEALAAVGALTQITSLYLHSDVPVRATVFARAQAGQLPSAADLALGQQGAAVMPLQHLVGLRQLQLSSMYLRVEPTGWLSHLTQLTLLGVLCDVIQDDIQDQPAAQQVDICVEAVVPLLQFSCPPSLQQVVLYMYGVSLRELLPSPLPGVPVYVRGEEVDAWLNAPEGRFAPSFAASMQPCPHLPGVWELL
jgi:hypothetical protein